MAVKKFYLTNTSATLDMAPDSGHWTNRTQTGVSALAEAPAGANVGVSQSHSGGTNSTNVLLRRFVTPPILQAGILTSEGLLADTKIAVAGNTGTSVRTAWRIWVVTPSNTVRGVMYAGSGGNNWPGALTGFSQTAPASVGVEGGVACQPGDRVVLDFGYQVRATGTVTGTMRYGGTGSDLQQGDTGTNATTRAPYIIFTGPNSSDMWVDPNPDPEPGGDISSRVVLTDATDRSGSGTFSVGVDSAPVNGEFLLASVAIQFENQPSVAMPGWNTLGSLSTPTGSYYPGFFLFWKWASSEPSSYSVTLSGGSGTVNTNVLVMAFTGVDTSDPIAGGPEFSTGGGPTGDSPSVTLEAPGRALWFGANQEYTADASRDYDWSSLTELADSPSVWCFQGWAYEDRESSGATGTRAWTVAGYGDGGGNTPSANGALALRAGGGSEVSGPEPGRFFLAL